MYCPCFVFVDLSNDHMHSFNDSPCLSLSYLVTIYIYIYWLNSFFVLLFLSCPFFPDSNFAFLCPFCLWLSSASSILLSLFCFALLCSLHRRAFLFAVYPHHSFSSSYASLPFCLLPPAFDVGLFPLVLILPPKLCQHSHIGRFFGFSCPFSPYSYTKVVTMSLLALMRMNSSERWRWNGRVSFSS